MWTNLVLCLTNVGLGLFYSPLFLIRPDVYILRMCRCRCKSHTQVVWTQHLLAMHFKLCDLVASFCIRLSWIFTEIPELSVLSLKKTQLTLDRVRLLELHYMFALFRPNTVVLPLTNTSCSYGSTPLTDLLDSVPWLVLGGWRLDNWAAQVNYCPATSGALPQSARVQCKPIKTSNDTHLFFTCES